MTSATEARQDISTYQGKKDSKEAGYAAKKFVKEKRFGSIFGKEDCKKEAFKISNYMKVGNCHAVDDKSIKNDKGELTLTETKKHMV